MADKNTQTYTLPSGAEIEVETLPERKAGASDVSFRSGDGRLLFDKVIEPLGEVADLLFSKIKSSVREPDSVTLEFAASLKGQTKLLIVSGEGQGSIKVSLTWNKPAA
ncbi:MAG: hypothetical protein GY862_14775 [Gammaproteobacteria bacterium]|nr:hypothetical protein [Gammaproteobacteria bacterium]